MSEQPELNDFEPEITSDDKLWALLAYVLSPLVPIIILFLEIALQLFFVYLIIDII